MRHVPEHLLEENTPDIGSAKSLTDKDRKAIHKAFANLYYGKCAYCEASIENPEIEHYRPKTLYSWLGKEWTNLLPSCPYCNGDNGSGKGSSFPLIHEENRRKNPPESPEDFKVESQFLQEEQPILLHPAVDNPFDYFTLNRVGSLEGIDKAGRGQGTIDLLELNRHKDLRAFIIDKFIFELSIIYSWSKEVKRISPEMANHLHETFNSLFVGIGPDQPHSFIARYVQANFESFINRAIAEDDFRFFVKEAYSYFTEKNG